MVSKNWFAVSEKRILHLSTSVKKHSNVTVLYTLILHTNNNINLIIPWAHIGYKMHS